MPFQLQYIWEWFLELHLSRHFNLKGNPMPLNYQDMMSWAMLTRRTVTPFDIKLIRQLDQKYFYVLANPSVGIPTGRPPSSEQVEAGVAEFLRAMRSQKKPKSSMVDLPKSVPVKPTKPFKEL